MAGKIVITLGKILNEFNLTKNRIAVESKVRPLTIHALVKNEAKLVRFDTLEKIVNTLNRLGNRSVTLEDVMIYQDDTK